MSNPATAAPATVKKHNFFAGPAILPQPVLEQAADAVRDFHGMGLSILEISHRSPQFSAVMHEAETLVRDLLGIGEEFAVLFLTGGASSQFFMTAMNLLDSNDTAGYVDTGTWSAKAIKEAAHFGNVNVLASSKAENYTYIPKDYTIPSELKYVHITSNNTVYGTQYRYFPDTDVPFVADMSSDIFSRPLAMDRFDLIYAGAQKNLGPAGVTLVIVRKDKLGRVNRQIPTMLDYQTHIKKASAFNTPPVYPIYVCMLTMRWIKALGGLDAMVDRNDEKASLLYDEIDRNPLFRGTVHPDDRSLMTATFVLNEAYREHEPAFLELAKSADIAGIKGHRSVGGFRASIYNAMPIESVQVLVDLMQEFERKVG